MAQAISRWRAEFDAAEAPLLRALLLHEVAVLEERLGDEAAAARDQLAAVNENPDFRESLEYLISIIERRQSHKNLGKLLERLVEVAQSPGERTRALLLRAAFLADQDNDLAGARETLEEALQPGASDAAVWLSLELLAGKLADDQLRERAIGARCELAQPSPWKALLLIDRAEVSQQAGDPEAALEALDDAAKLETDATFTALMALERLGLKEDRDGVVARALDAQGTLIHQSLDDSESGDRLGVPHHCRTLAHATDAWLRAAAHRRKTGDTQGADALLEKALLAAPGQPALLQARLATAAATGDVEALRRIAEEQLASGVVDGAPAASLWLRIAESGAARGDADAAMTAVRAALRADPTSIPARTLEIDLLSAGQDAQAIAAAFEGVAEQLSSDEARARAYLVSADTWGRLAGDAAGARAALSQAGMFGTSPSVVARVARMLATVVGDAAWYDEATRRLLAAGAEPTEQPSLWFELGRGRALRGDTAGAAQAFTSISGIESSRWLGHVLKGYALPLVPNTTGAPPNADDALAQLASVETDPGSARALRLALAVRQLQTSPSAAEGGTPEPPEAGESNPPAIDVLTQLFDADPADAVVARALSLVERARGRHERAAEVLARSAAQLTDPALRAALNLEAGIGFFRAGQQRRAVETFTAAQDDSPAAGRLMLTWALRAVEPDDLAARSATLDSVADPADRGPGALERFGLSLRPGAGAGETRDALALIGESASADIVAAGQLARSLHTGDDADGPEPRLQALQDLAARGELARIIARASAFHAELAAERLGNRERTDVARAAASWVETDHDNPAAAFEWLTASVGLEDLEQEVTARRALARCLAGAPAIALEASANLLDQLRGADPIEPQGGDDPAARLADLELARPGCDPRRRAQALYGIGDLIGAEATPTAIALAGYNSLVCGDHAAAERAFRVVVESSPTEVIGWEGLRAVGEATANRALTAEACAALGDAVSDSSQGAELWEHAGLVLTDELGDAERGEFAFARAVELDVRRPVAFDRLFRSVRTKKDGPRLLDLIARRIDVADDAVEIAKLYWERARVLRAAGDRPGALEALESVTMLEPDHVGALALSGEIYITAGRFAEAAEGLARLATLDEAPQQQRLMSGVAAVDLYENKLHDTLKALDVLVGLFHSGLSTLPVRERLARAAANGEAWQQATEVLEQLMMEREKADGRVEAARLAMAIYRDRLRQPGRALAAVQKLLSEAPDDGEALDLVLAQEFDTVSTRTLLVAGCSALVHRLAQSPLDAERVDRLARVALSLENAPLRQAALGVLVALGEGTPEMDRELSHLDQRVAHTPQIAIDDASVPGLADADDVGPVGRLMGELATTFAEALGPGLAAYGVTKREKIDPRDGLPVRNEITAWAGALGVGDFDLYVGGRDPNGVFAIPTERPAVVIGNAVTAPLSPTHRQAVARELFALRRGTTILRHRDAADIAALVVASCRIAGLDMQSPPYAMLAEFERQLSKGVSRKTRKAIGELAVPVVKTKPDPTAWIRAATSTLDRMAVVAAGDVSWVLAQSADTRGRLGASIESRERARRLLGFVLSPAYLELRDRLGMGVR
jgi:tetratricopeptide (TPR) repeat protein